MAYALWWLSVSSVPSVCLSCWFSRLVPNLMYSLENPRQAAVITSAQKYTGELNTCAIHGKLFKPERTNASIEVS